MGRQRSLTSIGPARSLQILDWLMRSNESDENSYFKSEGPRNLGSNFGREPAEFNKGSPNSNFSEEVGAKLAAIQEPSVSAKGIIIRSKGGRGRDDVNRKTHGRTRRGIDKNARGRISARLSTLNKKG